MRTVVVGVGNPILSDDSVGIKVAGMVRRIVSDDEDLEVTVAYAGGLRLMEAMAGYERAVIVDAMTTGKRPPGSVVLMSTAEGTRNLCCAHDGDLETALLLGRQLGLALPDEIDVVGVEAADVEHFSEELTPAVRAAIPTAVAAVLGISLRAGVRERT